VRELEHTIQRAVILSQGSVITSQHLLLDADREIAIMDLNQKLTSNATLADVLAEVEGRYIQRALLRADGNRHAAAKVLGIDIATLDKKLAEHGLEGRV
jgi:DNA-binding NtrC family response regulator